MHPILQVRARSGRRFSFVFAREFKSSLQCGGVHSRRCLLSDKGGVSGARRFLAVCGVGKEVWMAAGEGGGTFTRPSVVVTDRCHWL